MSVASTKAFYAHSRRDTCSAFGLAIEPRADAETDRVYRHELLTALRDCPRR